MGEIVDSSDAETDDGGFVTVWVVMVNRPRYYGEFVAEEARRSESAAQSRVDDINKYHEARDRWDPPAPEAYSVEVPLR